MKKPAHQKNWSRATAMWAALQGQSAGWLVAALYLVGIMTGPQLDVSTG